MHILISLFFAFTGWYYLPPTVVTITTTGAGTWSKPAGVTSVEVECWGGGGPGGAASTNFNVGGGGAGGQYAKKTITYASGASSISYTVAASFVPGINNATNGNDTNWESGVVVAKGGARGFASTGGSTRGTGSTSGGVGDIVYAGGNGSAGGANAGAGGGGAGSTGAGGNASTTTAGLGKTENGGNGGAGRTTDGIGLTGNNYGGGGGGGKMSIGQTYVGGTGAKGMIRLTYNVGRRKLIID